MNETKNFWIFLIPLFVGLMWIAYSISQANGDGRSIHEANADKMSDKREWIKAGIVFCTIACVFGVGVLIYARQNANIALPGLMTFALLDIFLFAQLRKTGARDSD